MLSSNLDENVISTEFRHEQVMNFIIGFYDGSVTLTWAEGLGKKEEEFTLTDRAELLIDIKDYASTALDGGRRNEIEQRIFDRLT